jgi:hypothetical protein
MAPTEYATCPVGASGGVAVGEAVGNALGDALDNSGVSLVAMP